MNIVYHIITSFLQEEKWKTIYLILISIIINIIQTKGLSTIIANIIESIHDANKRTTYTFFGYFVALSSVFLVLNYFYGNLQIEIMTKMRQWIRQELFSAFLKTNNENLSNVNFVSLSTPMNRTSTVYFTIFNSIISVILPIFAFFTVTFSFFIYQFPVFGICFALSNIIIYIYLSMFWKELIKKNNEYETEVIVTETHLLELLNNTDKIIHRGETINEMDKFKDQTKITIDKSIAFYILSNTHTCFAKTIAYIIVFLSFWFLIAQFYKKNIDAITFITFISILILYRDRMNSLIDQLDDFVESMGRSEVLFKYFKNIEENYESTLYKDYQPIVLNFEKITFENVYFKYESAPDDNYIFKNINVTLNTTGNKIIGIHGNSGKGKSTFVKLIMKLYTLTDGKIYIDDVDISGINPDYIRKNIIYVNQSGKLFDKEVINNLMYGCDDHIELCKERLNEIMKYDKIKNLYGNLDMETTKCGSLGENLSGGQRQIANVISGLIHPAKVLILDEPTNALDPELKQELLGIIKEFKKYKECIIIITHDSAVYPLFDEVLDL
jgi:ABC-type bacteriocin/lantibiotic exporter with double-glycine peptidase domain